MIVTYGKPVNFSTNVPIYTNNWNDCVVQCYKSLSCVVAFSPSESINCKLYNVNKIFEVEKLEASDGLLVAFKVFNSQETCPVGDNPPTFGDGPSYGSASTPDGEFPYEINFNSPNWSFNVTPICTVGWTSFTRPTTNWCIQVFGGPTVLYTQSQALAYCETLNATLTGFETTKERDFVADLGVQMLGRDYNQSAAFWISGQRKPECYSADYTSISYCNGANLQQFTFTDTHLTNYAGYTWDPNQPDKNASGTWANCIQIWIRDQAKFPQYNYTVYGNGNSDDAVCDVVYYPWYQLRGFACGKLPQLPV